MSKTLKTFIKWQGNKTKYIRYLQPHIPNEYNTYIEPFLGSGALFLKEKPKKWIVNDKNKDLINSWHAVMDNPEYIIDQFKKFGKRFKPLSNENKKKICIKLTSTIDESSFNDERAVKYLLMKFCSYMGTLCYKNKTMFMGLDMNIYLKNRCFFLEPKNYDNIRNVSDYLNTSKGKIMNVDFKNVLRKAKTGDFVFLDPPYIEDHDYGFNYNKDETKANRDFLRTLYEEVLKLDKKGVKWMMSQANTSQIKKIFRKYRIIKYKAFRYYTKSYTEELIILNYY